MWLTHSEEVRLEVWRKLLATRGNIQYPHAILNFTEYKSILQPEDIRQSPGWGSMHAGADGNRDHFGTGQSSVCLFSALSRR